MTQSLTRSRNTAPLTVEQALVLGDLSGLDPEQRVNYYMKVCTSLGLNPPELNQNNTHSHVLGRSQAIQIQHAHKYDRRQAWRETVCTRVGVFRQAQHVLPRVYRLRQAQVGSEASRGPMHSLRQRADSWWHETACTKRAPTRDGQPHVERWTDWIWRASPVCRDSARSTRSIVCDGDSNRLCHGAPSSDGAKPWATTEPVGTSASQEWRPSGQPYRESRTVEATAAGRRQAGGLPLSGMSVR
jgi:hypothetical protein